MKSARPFTCAALVIFAANAALNAQQPPAASANPIADAVRLTWESAKRNLKESAEQMSDADYAFRPTEQVRTFGEILAHVAGANYVFCSPARAEKSPHEEADFEKTARTKPKSPKPLMKPTATSKAAKPALTAKTPPKTVATHPLPLR